MKDCNENPRKYGFGEQRSAKSKRKVTTSIGERIGRRLAERKAQQRQKRFDEARAIKAIRESNLNQDTKSREIHHIAKEFGGTKKFGIFHKENPYARTE